MTTGNVSLDPTYLNIPIKRVYIGGESLPVVLREVKLVRAMNQHDSGSLRMVLTGATTYDGKTRIPLDETDPSLGTRVVEVEKMTGQTVSFVFGVSPVTESFVGYVVNVTPEQKFKEGVDFQIEVLGASLALQRSTQRFQVNLTLDELIRERVESRGLGFVGPSQTYRWPSIGQTQETDWEACQALAQRVGFGLATWETVVRLVDPVAAFKQYPYITLKSSDDVLESERTLMDFKPTETSADLYRHQGFQFSFFDGQTLRQVKGGGADTTVWRPLTSLVESTAQVDEWLKGVAGMSRWTQSASARIRGNAGVYPGMVVSVDTGSGSTTAQFNGRWLVVSVSHSMDRSVFQTELSLARPSTYPTASQAQFQHFWQEAKLPRPSSVVRNNEWSSSWARRLNEELQPLAGRA